MNAWDSEHVYFNGDTYFQDLERAIAEARGSVRLETYIFELDALGERVLGWLREAASRGVRTRLLVDGYGSRPWLPELAEQLAGGRVGDTPVEFRVFRPIEPIPFLRARSWFARMNRRNHRKVCIIDDTKCFAGSFNVTSKHCRSLSGDRAWRDTGLAVRGAGVALLAAAFDRAWTGKRSPRVKPLLGIRPELTPATALVRLNDRRELRRAGHSDLISRILRARRRIWITTPYFVPDARQVLALRKAARAGTDVRLILPAISDVEGMPWVAAAYYERLLEAGVRIFHYRPSILHAKATIIDHWAMIGSSNLDYRSVLHNLEADLVVTKTASLTALESHFSNDLRHSDEVTPEWLHRLSGVARLTGALGAKFRRWL